MCVQETHAAAPTDPPLTHRGGLRWIDAPARWLIIAVVWVYRGTLSPLIGNQCRYAPTCSQYMLEAVDKYGPWRGGWRGFKRILRCNPWCKGGIDPP